MQKKSARSTMGRQFPATFNMLAGSSRFIKHSAMALKGLIEFYHLDGIKSGLPGTTYYSGRALMNLSSATIGTALLLLQKPRLGDIGLLTGSLIAAQIAFAPVDIDNALKDLKSYFQPETSCKRKTLPKPTEYFSEARRINFDRLGGNYLYHPLLLQKYNKGGNVKKYVDLITKEAEKNDLNPILFANQLFRESAGFRSSVVSGKTNSPAGAVGIAQFLPSTAKRLYGASVKDLKDWRKAIPLAAQHMKNLKKQFYNDQILAMITYNGGEAKDKNPVSFVKRKLGKTVISGDQWMRFMDTRRTAINENCYAPSAWHNETFRYIANITGASWSNQVHKNALRLNKQGIIIKLSDLTPVPQNMRVVTLQPA